MSDYTPVPSNIATAYDLPDDGDNKPVSSVNPTLEGLADGVAHCNWPEQDTTKKYPLASRDLGRMQRSARWQPNWLPTGSQFEQQTPPTNQFIDYILEVPDGSTLIGLLIGVKGGSGHGALPGPGNKIAFGLSRLDGETSTNVSLVSLQDDSSPNVAAFEIFHLENVTVAGEVINNTRYLYTVQIVGEVGANAQPGGRIYGVQAIFTTTSQDPGAA